MEDCQPSADVSDTMESDPGCPVSDVAGSCLDGLANAAPPPCHCSPGQGHAEPALSGCMDTVCRGPTHSCQSKADAPLAVHTSSAGVDWPLQRGSRCVKPLGTAAVGALSSRSGKVRPKAVRPSPYFSKMAGWRPWVPTEVPPTTSGLGSACEPTQEHVQTRRSSPYFGVSPVEDVAGVDAAIEVEPLDLRHDQTNSCPLQENVHHGPSEPPKSLRQSSLDMLSKLCKGQASAAVTSTMDTKTWMDWAIGQCSNARPTASAHRGPVTKLVPRRSSRLGPKFK